MRSRERAGFPAGLSATAIPAAVSFALCLGLWLPSLIGPTRVDTVSLSGPAPSSAQRPATSRPLTYTLIGRTAPRALPLPTTHDRLSGSAQTHRQAAVSPPAMLRFDENRGQTDRRVRFLALDGGDTVFVTPDDAVLALAPPEAGGRCTEGLGPGSEIGACLLRLRFTGTNARAGTAGLDRLPGLSNDLIGSDPHKWQRAVPGYAVVTVRDLYRGVDLAYDGAPGYLTYTLTLAPRTDPRVVRLQPSLSGRLDAPGNLALSASLGADSTLFLGHLTAYQIVGGVRRTVSIRYAPRGLTAATITAMATATATATATGTVGFALGPYDHAQPLRITQTLGYGGTGMGGDTGNAVAAGGGGNPYIAGYVTLAEFPLGPAATAVRVTDLVAVTELSPGGSTLVYRTLLGGSGSGYGGFGDAARAIAVDGAGRAYVTGRTYAPDFPTTPGALARTLGSARGNAFVAKLSADGGALVYSTFLGGHGGGAVYVPADRGNAIAVDGAGHAYITGRASSPDFPTSAGALSRTLVGASDAFVTELDTNSGRLIYSTFLGGHGLQGNAGNGIALGDGGHAYVVGATDAPDFPTTDNAYATAPGGHPADDDNTAFVSELNANGSNLIYSTYLGGSRDDDGNAIAVDTAGRAFVTGQTGSSDFPTTQGAYATALGGSGATKGRNAFVAELTADGSDLVYGAYLGGSDADAGNGIVLDGRGHALVAGVTTSPNFPLTPGVHPSPGATAFVTELDGNGSKLVYSTTLAGKGAGIAVTRVSPGYIYVPLSSVTVAALPLH